MTLGQLFRFLLMLSKDRFWGEVTVRFKDGAIQREIQVRRSYVAETLPQPMPDELAQFDAEVQRHLRGDR